MRMVGQYPGKEAVIGADEDMAGCTDGDGSAMAADAGINDADVNGGFGKVTEGGGPDVCALGHVLGGDVVSYVDYARGGTDAEDDAFHGCDVRPGGAEVGEEGDYGAW